MHRKIDRAAEAKGIERGNRVLSILRPLFTHDVVRKIIRREFPQHTESEVFDILKAYKPESEEFANRVHLDSIKLSEGSLAELQQLIRVANQDFRDIVMPAENPRLHQMGVVAYAYSSEDEKDQITNDDLNDYLTWIQKP